MKKLNENIVAFVIMVIMGIVFIGVKNIANTKICYGEVNRKY